MSHSGNTSNYYPNFSIKALVEGSSQPFSAATKEGIVFYCNQAFSDLLGYPINEIVGMSWRDFTPAEWHKHEADMLDTIHFTGTPLRYEKEYQHRDGHHIPIEVFAHEICDDSVQYYYGFVTDLSARKSVLAKLKQNVAVKRTNQLNDITKHFFALSNDLFIIADLHGVAECINPTVTKTLGYTEAEVCSTNLGQYVHPDDFPSANAELQRVSESGANISNLQLRVKCKDHSYRWLEISSKTDLSAGLIYMVGRDISSKKEMELKLNKSHEQLESTLERISSAFYAVDSQWQCTYFNRVAETLWFKEKGSVIDKPLWDSFPYMVGTTAYHKLQQAFTDRVATRFEAPSVTYSGRYYEYHAYPTKDGLSVFVKDITARKKTELELQVSTERFTKIFAQSPVPMAIRRFDDMRFIEVNQSWLEHMGLSREEAIGRTSEELGLRKNGDSLKHLLRENGDILNEKVNYCTKKGDVRTALQSTRVIKLEGSECILGVLRDITEQERMEKEMSRLDRLNLVGKMAASIGHEIRNPLTTVRGFLQFIMSSEDTDKYTEYFDVMIEELDRANSIITEFLALSKDQATPLKRMNLNDTVNNIAPLIQAYALESDQWLQLNLGDITDTCLNGEGIRQLIFNLCRNGLEAMKSGQHLTVSTFMDGDQNVVLAVQDQGTGIEQEVLDKLGTPFYTTKDEGTGLGLAVCYSIAAQHDATIDIDTGERGTTFFVRFPARID